MLDSIYVLKFSFPKLSVIIPKIATLPTPAPAPPGEGVERGTEPSRRVKTQ